MYRGWHRGYGYRRGGFFWPGLLLFGLVVLVFGRFLWPLLFLLCFAVPFLFCVNWARWGRNGGWRYEKRKWRYGEYDPDEKPKRGGDESVEII